MITAYIFLTLCGLLGAYCTKLHVNGGMVGAIGIFAQGIATMVLWLCVSRTQKNLVVITAIWDAVYALSWVIGIYIFFRAKITTTQAIGIAMIIAGMVLANLKPTST